jgi:DNA-binding winged helix-turn-helix (wHTH) protein/TolB-like protein/Flp pilus assembly protein TadD
MSAERNRGYAFGNFRLYPEEALLIRSGQRVPLPPKTFKMLCVLVENRGHLMDKDELMRALWPDTFVVEANLRYNVSLLRKALTIDGPSQEFIATSPKFGYRFVADVREIEGENGNTALAKRESPGVGEDPSEEQFPPPEASQIRNTTVAAPQQNLGLWPARRLVVMVALLIAVAGFATFYRGNWRSKRQSLAAPTPQTLAVLPLRNLKPDPEADFLSLALTDSIINRLGYVNELVVLPTSSVIKYRNTGLDPKQIAHELKVSTVLTGSYVKEGDDIRITTELINVNSGAGPVRQSIELKYKNLVSAQDRLAASVLHGMGLSIQPQELQVTGRGLPTNPLAYEYYLRASDLSLKSNFEGAVRLLEKAVALEPENAMAWAALGDNYLGYARVQGGGEVYAEKGWEAFRKGRALDPENPFIRGLVAFQFIENNRLDEAIVLLREQLRQNTNDSWAHWYLSEAYRYGGALEESLKEGELARKLNPQIPENTTLNTYLYLGQYNRFLASLSSEDSARTSFYRGLAYYYTRDNSRALAEFDHAYALTPSLLHAQIGQALEDAVTGRAAKGIELMRTVEKSETEDGEMTYKMAQAYAQLGDKESSLRLLRRSIDLNFYPYSYFASDPLLQPVRGDTLYGTVIELAHQRQEAFQRKYF